MYFQQSFHTTFTLTFVRGIYYGVNNGFYLPFQAIVCDEMVALRKREVES